ncbi:MAG: ANTAR domain-containing protein [Nocardioidaceae bacterium]|nr:ANTAR domain-containing protein [Nocardioidaceae bacterium]
MLMERYELSADAAFALLRRASNHPNVRVVDIAATLVETRRLPHELPDHPVPGHPGQLPSAPAPPGSTQRAGRGS